MQAPSALVALLEPWAETYGNSPVLPTLVVFGHIAGLMIAGGLAIVLDRATIRAAHGSSDARQHQLGELRSGHRWVLGGLALSAATGVLLLAADVETYLGSAVFLTKAGLIVVLLLNGFAMTRAESQLNEKSGAGAWSRLKGHAVASMALWFATALAGVALVNS